MGKVGESELEYVLTQQEADDLVLEQAISITLEGVNIWTYQMYSLMLQ